MKNELLENNNINKIMDNTRSKKEFYNIINSVKENLTDKGRKLLEDQVNQFENKKIDAKVLLFATQEILNIYSL